MYKGFGLTAAAVGLIPTRVPLLHVVSPFQPESVLCEGRNAQKIIFYITWKVIQGRLLQQFHYTQQNFVFFPKLSMTSSGLENAVVKFQNFSRFSMTMGTLWGPFLQ